MKIRSFTRPKRRDNPEVSDDLERYVSGAFDQLEEISEALQRKLTIGSNLNSEIRAVELEDDTEVEVGLQVLRGAPVAAVLAGTDRFDYARLAWEKRDESRVALKVKWDTAFTGSAFATVIFFGADG